MDDASDKSGNLLRSKGSQMTIEDHFSQNQFIGRSEARCDLTLLQNEPRVIDVLQPHEQSQHSTQLLFQNHVPCCFQLTLETLLLAQQTLEAPQLESINRVLETRHLSVEMSLQMKLKVWHLWSSVLV